MSSLNFLSVRELASLIKTREASAAAATDAHLAQIQRNLRLSVLPDAEDELILYLPMTAVTLSEGALVRNEAINQTVDFSLPLYRQHDFSHVVQGGEECVAN